MYPFATAVVTSLVLPLASALVAQDSSSPALRRSTLDNGLEVAVVENHGAPLATVLVAVRSGSLVQERGQQGISHLCEHLLLDSYGGEAGKFASDAGELHGYSNGATGREVVTYFLTLPSENAEKGIRLLGRLFERERFRDDDLEDVRAVMLDELERSQSDPENVLARQVSRALWGDAWYMRDVSGDSLSLERIDTDAVNAHYLRYYRPNNAALIVTGDVVFGDVVDAARRHFGDWEWGLDPFIGAPRAPAAPLVGTQEVVVTRKLQDVTVQIQMQSVDFRADPEATYAADVLTDLLNDPRSALQQRLVDSGQFESLRTSFLTSSGVGQFSVVGKTSVAGASAALIALVAQLDSLDQLPGITAADLAVAKKSRQVGAALALEEIATLAPSLAFWWATTGLDYYVSHPKRVDAQTLDDLRQFTKRYVVNQPRVIGVLGPDDAAASMAKRLRGS